MSASTPTQEGVGAPHRKDVKLQEFHEERPIATASDARLLLRLWPFVRPHVRFMMVALIMLAFVTVLNLIRPLLMGHIVKVAADKRADLLLRDGFGLVGLMIVTQAMTFAQMYLIEVAGAHAMADLRAYIFSFMQRLALRFVDRTPVGRLVTRATSDVDALGELFIFGVPNAVGDVFSLVAIVVTMLALDWRMSLVAFGVVPIVVPVVNFARRRARQANREIRTMTARLNAFLHEQLSGIAVVQAFGREEAMQREFDEINLVCRDANKRNVFYAAALEAVIEMIATVCVASILWWAGLHRVGQHLVTFSVVVTFTQYIRQFFEPINMLSQRYTILQNAMSGAERVYELLDVTELEPSALPAHDCLSATRPREAIVLEGVSFEYKPDVPVLKNVSLRVRHGERVALVGATGAGKTTVASLILRLYEPQGGTIRVLGKDVRAYDPQSLREKFSVVPQDVFLFGGTVLSNVAMSDPHPDPCRASRALECVGALDLFLRREGGLGAPVDERGANFSAGERQLLALARAVYRDAPILILDEATASVDSDTEARLHRALNGVMEKRTSLVIAHRLSTIRSADRIVVFHKGRVVETGSHEELIERKGIYARLYRMQTAHERILEQEAQFA